LEAWAVSSRVSIGNIATAAAIGLIAFVLLAPAGSPVVTVPSAVDSSTELFLPSMGVTFNTVTGAPSIPDNLRIGSYPAGAVGTYLVQFNGPMEPSFRRQLADAGAKVYNDLYSYAVLAKMDSATKSIVKAMSNVGWVGIYQPAYKLDPALLSAQGTIRVAVNLYDIYDNMTKYTLAFKLSDMGATVIMISDSVEITVDSSLLPAIASMEEVLCIERSSEMRPMDSMSGKIHKVHDAWYTSWSGLPYNLTGTDEVIGIQDTGFGDGDGSRGYPDFYYPTPNYNDPSCVDRCLYFQDMTGNSVPDGNWPADSSAIAHGTHCVGIFASDGACWEHMKGIITDDKEWHHGESGTCPEVFFIAFGTLTTGGGLSVSITYWDNMHTLDARTDTYTGSFGSNPGNYDSTWSGGHDTRCNTDNTRLFCMAAGNSGPESNTLHPGSQAKNGFACGACENYRPEWFQSDDPNLVWSGSARGGTGQSNARIKPDLITTGTSMISNLGSGQVNRNPNSPEYLPCDAFNKATGMWGSDGIPEYQYMSGTSSAPPMIAGMATLVREYYKEVKGLTDATTTAHLIKATMINGAVRESDIYKYPGYDQGWGRVDLQQALFPPAPKTVQYYTGTISAVGWVDISSNFNLNVYDSDTQLKVTLAWIDTSGVALNRNLDLRVTDPTGALVYKGNSYPDVTSDQPGFGYTPPNTNVRAVWMAASGYDNDNNVEQVEIKNPATGQWKVEVNGATIPSAANYAVVVSADVGQLSNYDVELGTDQPTTINITRNGDLMLPFRVLNYGLNMDNIALIHNPPTGLSVTYDPTSPLNGIASGATRDVVATISADNAIAAGTYSFEITGTSQLDPATVKAADILKLTVEVRDQRVPTKVQLTNSTLGQYDPSVVTFTDVGGTKRIFVSYLQTAVVGGARVRLMHATLDANGDPVAPWTDMELPRWVTNNYTWPNDARIYWMSGGLYRDRVFVVWTGIDPTIADQDYGSASYISYADSPWSSWTTVRTNLNTFSLGAYGQKRVNFLCARPGANQLLYGFEHLDFNAADAQVGVDSHATISNDGGATWGAAVAMTPGDGNFYFFPNGHTDQNGVVWIFYYWRTASSNSRDIRLRLYDGAWSAMRDVWDTGATETNDNLQWPASTSTAEGAAGNRQYLVVLRDVPTPYQLWTTYIDGDYTSAVPPANSANGWANARGPFGTDVGTANYDRRPVNKIVATSDGCTWVPYQELTNPYPTANLWTVYSNNAFASVLYTKITTDGFAKGHEMASTLTVGAYSYVYEVFHANLGTCTDVDYNVYLAKYKYGWAGSPDTTGPITNTVMANPNPYNLSVHTSFQLKANINDIDTGFSNIASAEYKESTTDPGSGAWGGAIPMTIGTNSPVEIASATVVPTGWSSGQTHTFWVHGMDSMNNWGAGAKVDIYVLGEPLPLVWFNISVSSTGWNLISIPLIGSTALPWALTDLVDGGAGLVQWDRLMFYSPNAPMDKWKLYNKNWIGSLNDLTAVDRTMGVWINVTSVGDGSICIGGNSYPTSTSIQLWAGWNLVGYPSLSDDVTVAEAFWGTGADAIEIFDSLAIYKTRVVGPTHILRTGEGYWVHVPVDSVWTVDW
jgi:hypothetical protein